MIARLLACALLLAPAWAAAQDRSSAELAQAKSYFRAGASAYELGDYLAAIQALEAAYRITPLPAIAFSLAQAERRQYFVSRDHAHLARAIELFRTYLGQVAIGGRRADATDALAQLEPIAALGEQPSAASGEPLRAPGGDRTRLMISCTAPGARVELDGGESASAPLIARVTPGLHRVRVRAPGYFDSVREIEAITGELIPLEITLRERPAIVRVRVSPEAELHIDGQYTGRVAAERRLELPSGAHTFSFAKNGHELKSIRAELAPGASRTIAASLETTAQRNAAYTLFVVSGAALATGAVLTGLAIARENDAQDLDRARDTAAISPRERNDYGEAQRDRDRLRWGAGITYGVAFASFVTGLFLFTLDQPDVREPAPAAELRVGLPGPERGRSFSLTGRFRF